VPGSKRLLLFINRKRGEEVMKKPPREEEL
jgi:hypothetical protein